MFRIVNALLLTAVLGCGQTLAQDTQPSSQRRPKVAVFTFAGGYKHAVLPLAEETVKRIGEQSGTFDALCLELHQHAADEIDLSMVSAEWLKQFDAVLFFTTGGEKDERLLTEAQRRALLEAVKSGLGFIGIHSAADTFRGWPEYGEMLGAFQDGAPWLADGRPVTLKVEDPDHPVCLHVGPSWFLQEEILQFKEPYARDKLHVLISLDTRLTNVKVPGVNRTDDDFALAWTKYYGEGRVFYTALGHREEVWRSELFQKHLGNGIRWVLGQVPGKPLPPGTPDEEFVRLPNGLQYRDIVVGDGPAASRFNKLTVHYVGWLLDGTRFGDSRAAGEPLKFTLGVGAVIRGWDEGLLGMQEGGKRKLIIPSILAYGARGAGDVIPPHAKLIYEIELLKVERK